MNLPISLQSEVSGKQTLPVKSMLKRFVQRRIGSHLGPLALRICARMPSWLTASLMRLLTGIQLSAAEICLIARAIVKAKPCNLLVFGLGRDSAFWAKLNRGGQTVFLEDVEEWLDQMRGRFPWLRAHLVSYTTRRPDWQKLLEAPDQLAMALPAEVRDVKWDVILVDAPAGNNDTSPGRMQSIHMAAQLAKAGGQATIVFVHDCLREVEQAYCDRYLMPQHLVGEVDLLRQYEVRPAAK